MLTHSTSYISMELQVLLIPARVCSGRTENVFTRIARSSWVHFTYQQGLGLVNWLGAWQDWDMGSLRQLLPEQQVVRMDAQCFGNGMPWITCALMLQPADRQTACAERCWQWVCCVDMTHDTCSMQCKFAVVFEPVDCKVLCAPVSSE